MSKLPDVSSDAKGDTGVRPTEVRPPSIPRWVKVTGIIAIVLVLAFVVLRFTGHGPSSHGPSRHTSGENTPHGGGHL